MKLELSLPIMALYVDKSGIRKMLGDKEVSSFYSLISKQFQANPQWQFCRDWRKFISAYKGKSGFADKIQSMEIVPVLEKKGMNAKIVFRSVQKLDEEEKDALTEYIKDQLEKGWGDQIGSVKLQKSGGELQVHLLNPDYPIILINDQIPPEHIPPKYRITDIQHPVYKECYRIQAIRDVDQDVRAGEIGGYIEKKDNLSQAGTCWIEGDAVCRGNAQICGASRVRKNAELKGEALVTGSSLIQGCCLIEGNSYIKDAVIEENARVTGNAIVESQPDSRRYPVISGNSQIYGSVIGNFEIDNSTVFPEEKLYNMGEDQLLVENGIKRAVSLEHIQKEAVNVDPWIKKSRIREQERER